MKNGIARVFSALLCVVLLLSAVTVMPSCKPAAPESAADESAAAQNNNVFIDADEAAKLSDKLIVSQNASENEVIAVDVDPFLEEQFLLQVDQYDRIETVRKVAEGDGKAVYAIALADVADNTPAPTEAATPAAADVNTELVAQVTEQVQNMVGVDSVVATAEMDIPLSDMEKTYKGPTSDAEGNLLVPFDVAYPEVLESEATLFEKEHILLKLPADFDGNVTRELTLCGISKLTRFLETEMGNWFKAELFTGVDTVTAVKKARSLTMVIASEFDYIYETTDTEAGDDNGEGDGNDPTDPDDPTDPTESTDPLIQNPRAAEQWYLNSCGIPQAWQFLEDHGICAGGAPDVVVAVIDTGVDYTHPDLITSMWVNMGEIPDNGIDDDGNGYIDDIHGVDVIANNGNPMDDHGHGTHVAGIIGAANNKEGIVGVAYNTKIMAVKAGQASGVFNQSDIAEAILYAAANGADVINMSFGGTATSLTVQDALATAYTRSVLVAAAGNDGASNQDFPFFPAAYSYVLGVMSISDKNWESSFSNFDYAKFNYVEYEVYAPGEKVLSTFPNGRYISLNGTSMAAPIVSGIAALLRSYYADLDLYPSRFIAAQISSTSDFEPFCPHFIPHNTPMVADAFAALSVFPKPDVHLYDYYITDNYDGIIDSGDTLEIGLILQNRWGMSKDTIVTIDTRTAFLDADTGEIIYGPENPYLEVLNGSTNFDSIGTYSTKSMVVYDDYGAVIGIENPFIVKVSNDCPNDYICSFRITISYSNGLDEFDENEYNNGLGGETVSFTVRNGIIKKGQISEDEIWTKNNYYIISDMLLIPEGVTVTVEPGTKIIIDSSSSLNMYAQNPMPKIYVDGTLNIIGTEDEPVEISNRECFNQYGDFTGNINLKYVVFENPRLETVGLVDHCFFSQSTLMEQDSIILSYDSYLIFRGSKVTNSCFKNIIFNGLWYGEGWNGYTFNMDEFDHCLFYGCGGIVNRANKTVFVGETVFKNYMFDPISLELFNLDGISELCEIDNHIYYRIALHSFAEIDELLLYTINDLLNEFGGSLACFETVEEWNNYSSICAQNRLDNAGYIGLITSMNSDNTIVKRWINGSDLIPWVQTDTLGFYYYSSGFHTSADYCFKDCYYDSILVELPRKSDGSKVTKAELMSIVIDCTNGSFNSNVILNDFNSTSDFWFKVNAGDNSDRFIDVSNNYWGTIDEEMIGYQIVDVNDYPTYGMVLYDPYLLAPPEDVWPLVTDAYLLDHNGERVFTVGNEEVTFVVEFNRDMDTDYGLRVRFGAAEPYAEYEIPGEFVTPRRWEGVYTLKTTIENGTQYFRIENGRAADDHWLTLYERPARFRFEIDTTSAMAMVMQGEATDTGIDLTWLQDDYDTLAGYNIYRSTREDGYCTKLNNVVIPVGSEHFFDDTVEPGVVYYYNFTVVLTDMSESTPSGKITIMSKDTMAPNIYHTPVRTAYTGSKLIITATVTDNLGLSSVKLYYRTVGTDDWSVTEMVAVNNKYNGIIPADKLSLDGLEYYIEAFDGVNYTYNGSAASPYAVTVKQAVEASSLGDVDGDGVITGKDALMIVQAINDLLNLTEDQFMRADINGDGELSSAEALRILKYVSGKVTTIVG